MAASKAAISDLQILERALTVASRQAINSEGTWGETLKRLTLIRSWINEAERELREIRFGVSESETAARIDWLIRPPVAERPSHD